MRGNVPAASDRTLADDIAVLAEYQREFLNHQDSECFASDLHQTALNIQVHNKLMNLTLAMN